MVKKAKKAENKKSPQKEVDNKKNESQKFQLFFLIKKSML